VLQRLLDLESDLPDTDKGDIAAQRDFLARFFARDHPAHRVVPGQLSIGSVQRWIDMRTAILVRDGHHEVAAAKERPLSILRNIVCPPWLEPQFPRGGGGWHLAFWNVPTITAVASTATEPHHR
jgi:hypothetical protein